MYDFFQKIYPSNKFPQKPDQLKPGTETIEMATTKMEKLLLQFYPPSPYQSRYKEPDQGRIWERGNNVPSDKNHHCHHILLIPETNLLWKWGGATRTRNARWGILGATASMANEK